MARRIEPRRAAALTVARTACLAAIVAACGAPGAPRPDLRQPDFARRLPNGCPGLRQVRRRLQPHLRRRGRRLPQGRPASRWTALRRRRARTTPGRSIRKPLSRICSGRDGGTVFDDLWSFDLASDAWTRLQLAGRRPPPGSGTRRRGSQRHGLLVTLGQAGATFFADVWLFDPTSGAWRSCPATVRRPCRATAAAPASGRTAGSGSPTASPRRARGSSTPGPTTSMPRPERRDARCRAPP